VSPAQWRSRRFQQWHTPAISGQCATARTIGTNQARTPAIVSGRAAIRAALTAGIVVSPAQWKSGRFPAVARACGFWQCATARNDRDEPSSNARHRSAVLRFEPPLTAGNRGESGPVEVQAIPAWHTPAISGQCHARHDRDEPSPNAAIVSACCDLSRLSLPGIVASPAQ